MRAFTALVLALAVGSALAEPAPPSSAAETAERAEQAAPAKASSSASQKGKGDRSWLFAPIKTLAPKDSDVRPLDLGPSRLFATGTPRLTTQRKGEKGAIAFGDGTWKTHALQVGGMVAGWAALAALCGNQRCMLPKGLTSWMPGTTTEAAPAPARVGPQVRGLPTMRRPR